MWGELYYWSLVVNNLKICVNEKDKTKYEVFKGVKPDIRRIRLLPILCAVYVLKKNKTTHPLKANKEWWQLALYTGPSSVVAGPSQ